MVTNLLIEADVNWFSHETNLCLCVLPHGNLSLRLSVDVLEKVKRGKKKKNPSCSRVARQESFCIVWDRKFESNQCRGHPQPNRLCRLDGTDGILSLSCQSEQHQPIVAICEVMYVAEGGSRFPQSVSRCPVMQHERFIPLIPHKFANHNFSFINKHVMPFIHFELH